MEQYDLVHLSNSIFVILMIFITASKSVNLLQNHFATLSQVGDGQIIPDEYWHNNLRGSLNLIVL